MKKELVRIFNLNCQYTDGKRLQNVSLLVTEGDRIGFFGLSQSGKDFLLQLLTGKENVEIQKLDIYLRGEKAEDISQLKNFFYWMAAMHAQFSWTVAEYVHLQENGWLMLRKQKQRLLDQSRECFEELNIDIDVSKKIYELSEIEKRIVEIVRAHHHGASVLVIEDEFEGLQREDIQRFSRILGRIQEETGMAVIINSHSDLVMEILTEKSLIFKNGRIVKKGYHKKFLNSEHAENYLLGRTMSSKKKSLEAYSRELKDNADKSDEIVYSLENYRKSNGEKVKLDFCKGKITTLLINDNEEKERLFEALAGWELDQETVKKINGERVRKKDIGGMIEKRVVGIKHLGGKDEVFSNMRIADNLILPSLRKLTHVQYILHSAGLTRSISVKHPGLFPTPYCKMSELETDERIAVMLERWYIYNPRVLILMEPFVSCDIYGVSIVKNYLRKFTSKATAIVILKSREEYIEDLSDEIIVLG